MSSSEVVTHRFIDEEIWDVEVGPFFGERSERPTKVVFFSLKGGGSGPPTAALSKEDLLHLLKLIEETN